MVSCKLFLKYCFNIVGLFHVSITRRRIFADFMPWIKMGERGFEKGIIWSERGYRADTICRPGVRKWLFKCEESSLS